MYSSGLLKRRLLEPRGELGDKRAVERGTGRQRSAGDRDLLQRPLPAHPARRRGVEASGAGIAREGTLHLDRVGRQVVGKSGVAQSVDQAFPIEETERQLLV